MPREKALIVGISGGSSSGKTTLSRLLRDIFPRTFIMHQDDFYKPDGEIPVKDGIADWDCLEAFDVAAFEQTLVHIRQNGAAPPHLNSKEDQNSVGEVKIDPGLVEDLKRRAAKWTHANTPPIAIFDGLLMYSEDMRTVRELFDVKMFLQTDYKTAKARREARSGYVTLEGFWEDPPGYVDQIVWPNYVRDHAFLFRGGNVEGEFNEDVLARLSIEPMPADGQGNLGRCLLWAFGIIDNALNQRSALQPDQ